MTKFNLTGLRRRVPTSPISTEIIPSARTFEGAPGHARDAKSELFLLAVGNMVGEDTFYEAATERDARFRELVAAVAVSDPDWTARLDRLAANGREPAIGITGRGGRVRPGPARCRVCRRQSFGDLVRAGSRGRAR